MNPKSITPAVLERWCRKHEFVTARDAVDYERAADALGIGWRSLFRYLKGEAEIPAYVGLAMVGYDTLNKAA